MKIIKPRSNSVHNKSCGASPPNRPRKSCPYIIKTLALAETLQNAHPGVARVLIPNLETYRCPKWDSISPTPCPITAGNPSYDVYVFCSKLLISLRNEEFKTACLAGATSAMLALTAVRSSAMVSNYYRQRLLLQTFLTNRYQTETGLVIAPFGPSAEGKSARQEQDLMQWHTSVGLTPMSEREKNVLSGSERVMLYCLQQTESQARTIVKQNMRLAEWRRLITWVSVFNRSILAV